MNGVVKTKNFADNLRRARLKKGFSQAELAELEDEGVDAIFASVDEYGNVEDVECVSADNIDPAYQEKLGDEGMLVINR